MADDDATPPSNATFALATCVDKLTAMAHRRGRETLEVKDKIALRVVLARLRLLERRILETDATPIV